VDDVIFANNRPCRREYTLVKVTHQWGKTEGRMPFWATVCKTVRPMLSDCCLYVCQLSVCLSVLSATLVYCGQMVGWTTMSLGIEVGIGPGHIVLDGDPCSSPMEWGTAVPPLSRFTEAGMGRDLYRRRLRLYKPRPMCIVAKRSPISATAEHLFCDPIILLIN